jgi:hypothetical protein
MVVAFVPKTTKWIDSVPQDYFFESNNIPDFGLYFFF